MALIEVLPVKVFTRERQATKVDLTNCFWNGRAFIARPVVQTRGIIGLNVPKYLHKHGLAETVMQGDVECLKLTAAGEAWLREGLAKHLQRHPDERERLTHSRAPAPAPASPRPARRLRGSPPRKRPR